MLCSLITISGPWAKFTVSNGRCKYTFQIVFLMSFHIFFSVANCLSDVITSTLFLSPRIDDKELVSGAGAGKSQLSFFMSTCG